MSGYGERRLGIREADVRGLDEIRIDAELEPLAETAVVSGIVTDMDGLGVGGAAVRLYSPGSKQSFHAASSRMETSCCRMSRWRTITSSGSRPASLSA